MDHTKQILARTRGTTMLELTITLGITTVILLTLYGFLMTQALVSVEENSELSTQNSVRQGAQQLFDELEMCKPKRLDSMGAWFEYYLPKAGANGGFELDATGNLIYGVLDGTTWYPNGFYCVTFVRSNEAQDYLAEADLHLSNDDIGTDLNGNGTFTDVFIGGWLTVTSFDSTGMTVGAQRFLTGKFFMQLDPAATSTSTAPITNPAQNYTNVDSMNLTVFPTMGNGDPAAVTALRIDRMPYKGLGVFLMRQLNGVGAQKADAFIDTNSNGILDSLEIWTDTNINGFYDEWDSEPFTDSNGNNIRDPIETYVDSNHNGKYDCRMTLQFITFKTGRTVTESGDTRDKSIQLKFLRTKVRFKNTN
ncbi:MAG: hypothetical protein WCT04_24705 [Planctomycetota bacterium]